MRGIEDPLGLTCAACLCVAGLFFRLLPLFSALGLLFGLLLTNGLEDGVPTICFLGVMPELVPW